MVNNSPQCCRRLRLRARWASWNICCHRSCTLRRFAQVSAPGQCRWGFVRKSLLLACMKAQNSQLYLLLLEPDQVGMNGVLFVHATSSARGFCRDSVDLRRVVPRYGPHTWVRPHTRTHTHTHTHTHTPAGNQPALSSTLVGDDDFAQSVSP